MEDLDPLDVARRHPAIKLAVPTITAVVGVLGFVVMVSDIRPTLDSLGGFIVFTCGFATIVLLVVIYVMSYILA